MKRKSNVIKKELNTIKISKEVIKEKSNFILNKYEKVFLDLAKYDRREKSRV